MGARELGRWCAGAQVCWCAGALVRWGAGAMDTRIASWYAPDVLQVCARELGCWCVAHCDKYSHCVVFIAGPQASGRWIDGAIPRLRINWEFISVCRKLCISVRSSGVCAGQIIPGFSAVERMRKLHYLVGLLTSCGCRRPAVSQLVRRRSQGTLDVQRYTPWPRQVFPGQQSPSHIPPFLCCQGPLCKRSMWSPFKGVCGRDIGSGNGSGSCRNHVSPSGPDGGLLCRRAAWRALISSTGHKMRGARRGTRGPRVR